MLKHGDIWSAIDRLAAAHGMSTSGLARRSGLDPTTFNKSKRVTIDGKQRWPSTESVAKILEATGASMADFVGLIGPGDGAGVSRRIPVIDCVQAGTAGFFDDAGHPTGSGWDEVQFPNIDDPHAYALEVTGDSMEPIYREGDIIVVSPDSAVRRGDRILLKTVQGEVMGKQLLRRTVNRVEVKSLNPMHGGRTLKTEEIAWMARIVWVSQ
jgi:phage repressor protein C with HTH and peptisase S24 domain